MKFTRIRFRLPIEHPTLGGFSASRDVFEAPEFDIETTGAFVRLSSAGKTRLVNLSQVLWADEPERPVESFAAEMGGAGEQQRGQQFHGKRGKR